MPGTGSSPTEKLQLLYKISLQLSSTLNLDDVLGKVLSLTVSTLGASKGSIFVLGSDGRVVRRLLARGDLPLEDSRQVVARVMEVGLAGWVYRHRTPAIISDTRDDKRWVTFSDDTTTPRSALAVPLVRGEIINGLLTLVHPHPGFFSNYDVELAVAIAGLAAVAVEHALLFAQVNAERRTLAAVLQSVRAAIVVTNAEQRILLLNPSAAAILETDPQEAIGKPLEAIIANPSLLQLYEQSSPDMIAPITGEVHTADNSSFNATLSPVPGVGYATVLHDITFLKRLNDLKTESLTAVSHDLRGPLGIILGSAQMMVQHAQEQSEFIELITSAVDRMRTLVERQLDLSRIEAGQHLEWETAPIQEALDDVLIEARAQAQLKQVQFSAHCSPDLPPIRMDRMRLGQAVANLLDNAIKYTPAGGRVMLSAGKDPDQEAIVIRVTDTGPGIPPEALPKLFSRYSQVDSVQTVEQQGVGLGLAIVRSVAKVHGGRAWAESELGQGATFAIAIPYNSAPADGSS